MRLPKRRRKYDSGGYITAGASGLLAMGNDISAYKNADEFSDNTAKGELVGGIGGAILGGTAGLFLGNPLLGAQLGYAGGKNIGGRIGGNKDAKDITAADNKLKAETVMTNGMINYDINRPVSSPGLGYYRRGGKLRYGGAVGQYEAEKDEVIVGSDTQIKGNQLASNVVEVGGDTHEDGGTMGSGGEFVYSDSLDAPKDYVKSIKSYVGSKPRTYADIATKLGKLKGKYEDKVEDGSPRASKTGMKMMSKINDLLSTTALIQEINKPVEEQAMKSMRYGGKIKRYTAGGGITDPYGMNFNNDYLPMQPEGMMIDPLSSSSPISPWEPAPMERIPTLSNHSATYNSGNSSPVRLRQFDGRYVAPSTTSLNGVPKTYSGGNPTALNTLDSDVNIRGNRFDVLKSQMAEELQNPYAQADLMNLANYGMNLATINKMKQYNKPINAPVRQSNFYRDRRGSAGINNMYATAVRKGMNPALSSNLFASATRGIADYETQQSVLENTNRNQNIQNTNRIDAYNTSINNDYLRSLIDVENQKTSDRLNARNTATAGYMQNRYAQRMDDAEMDRMVLAIESDPDRVSNRYMDRVQKNPALSPYTRNRLKRFRG